ncbi:MAG: elongation factor G [Clostridia bacterium]|nr:elongation factor G [Clostridia bacterium]
MSNNLIRNVALIGHGGAGKTSLAEAILFNGGAIDKLGKVVSGNTVMDFTAEEIERKTSVSLACAYTNWNGVKINIVDVPGFYDFEGEFEEAVRAVGSAILVADACGFVSVGAEKAINYCLKRHVPLIIFVNGIDKENADYVKTADAFKTMYGRKIATMHAPIIRNGKMQGYVSVVSGKAYEFKPSGREEIPVPQEMESDVAALKNGLIEAAAETSDVLLEKFFESGWLSNDDIIAGIKQGLRSGDTIPILGGSATQNIGVINLMNEIVDIMPSPSERRPVAATLLETGEKIKVFCDENLPFAGQIFKTVVDPFAGKLSYIRVFTGLVKVGDTVYDAANDKEEKIGALYLLKGKKQESVNSLSAGEIGAIGKLSDASTGDTLCNEKRKIKFSEIKMPPAVYAMAIRAKRTEEEDKVFSGLNKLREEDKSFVIEKNVETGETVIKGLGETQLDVICQKLKNKYGCSAELSVPEIAYKETITAKTEAEGKHKKQSGGAGQFGVVNIRFEAGAQDGLFEFVDETVGGSVPKPFIPAVEKGLREAIKQGPLANYPVVNLKCTLFDGKYHPVDSKEVAFVSAARLAFDDAMTRAKPVLLEPIYSYRITVPSDYLGDVLGDISKRRGRVLGMDPDGEQQTIFAEIPLAEMANYAMDLRSMTQARGKFSGEFARYETVPFEIQEKITAARKKQ